MVRASRLIRLVPPTDAANPYPISNSGNVARGLEWIKMLCARVCAPRAGMMRFVRSMS